MPKNLQIMQQINAFRILEEKGLEEAIRLYPDFEEILRENEKESFTEVKAKLERELYA